MASLLDGLRRQLEKTVVAARDEAERGARAAVERLAVQRVQPFSEMTPAERELRVRLRAHARQLGDPRKENGEQGIEHLVGECAYEHWHRMLFARFLAENRLLIHPDHGVPVTLAECEELAAEAGEGDGWKLAGRFAARMLPAIFRPDDPVLAIRLAPEHQQSLEQRLGGLPTEVFTADDSLGWVYQFWQTKRKSAVNASGRKIGADELPAVTQLFTEPYMVKFLLHNTLGAWWAGKVLSKRPDLAAGANSEDELRSECALPGCAWTYLRFTRSERDGMWGPAAGTFESWPRRAAEITVLDPCCGSGHFMVEAFRILVPLRKAEEGLSAREAGDAVLRDNLFGLELDERCTQIAAFNLALSAWNYPDAGGVRSLPELHIACSGLSVGAKEEEWIKLASRDDRLRHGMRRLHRLFKDAPTLGSLIDPRREDAELHKSGFEELQPLLAVALNREETRNDAPANEAATAAQGMAESGTLLAGTYTLVGTNVPYLARHNQGQILRAFAEKYHSDAKTDLATTFVSRLYGLVADNCTMSIVVPTIWLTYTAYYEDLRRRLLGTTRWDVVGTLGKRAFRVISGEVVDATLFISSTVAPSAEHTIAHIDVGDAPTVGEKALSISARPIVLQNQATQLRNPGAVPLMKRAAGDLLSKYVTTYEGLSRGDTSRFDRKFWEVSAAVGTTWKGIVESPAHSRLSTGRSTVFMWEEGRGELSRHPSARVQGTDAWGRAGVLLSRTHLNATLSLGDAFAQNCVCMVPKSPDRLLAIWCFVQSEEYRNEVQAQNQKLIKPTGVLDKVPFDHERWQAEALRRYPSGLPRAYSDDPTQWFFHGHPLPCALGPAWEPPWPTRGTLRTDSALRGEGVAWALQVAVARLVNYRWPAELNRDLQVSEETRLWIQEAEGLHEFVADDGIVCIPSVLGEQPAADRLQRLLARALAEIWSPGTLALLLEEVGFKDKTLEEWLRSGFFDQHCTLFQRRPFVWHIWDGRPRDGFAALVNYQKLNRKLLERLAYTHVGDWIMCQRQAVRMSEPGAEERLSAAQNLKDKLALILDGDPPYDIFARWKPLSSQPMGWEPDLDDGVRVNIRPFVEAGVLRRQPRIDWSKDNGSEPEALRPQRAFPWFWAGGQFDSDRVNSIHIGNAEKRAVRARKATGGTR